MQPLFRNLVVGVAPQPRKMPPTPFTKEELQRCFFDVTRSYPYSQFAFLPIDGGAQLLNGPEDRVLIQPGLLQLLTPVELTAELARQKAVDVFSAIAERLQLAAFVQTGIKVVAHVVAPGENPDARMFVSERLMGGSRADELGASFFGGGVKYRSLASSCEQNLLVEPLIADEENKHLWLDYDMQRRESTDTLDKVGEWIDDAFDFIRGPAMSLLEV
jgi:hypothetical protein